MPNLHGYSVAPPSAVYGASWPSASGLVLTQGYRGALSVAGWTSGNEGYPQQTFLGASLRSFNVSAGFGDTSSTMGIELVNDEFNKSDGTPLGQGDDVYHSGNGDKFTPPVVGSPVFFKFGKNFATLEQAFRKDFDQIYKTDTLEMPDNPFPIVATTLPIYRQPNGYYLLEKNNKNQTAWWINKSALLNPETKWRGFAHFTFGGILQSYTENRSPAGNPLYSVKLVDPREILTNTQLVLSNYQGTTFNNKNLYNIYGFLEYDPSHKLVNELESKATKKSILEKKVDPSGYVSYTGRDEYIFESPTSIEHFSGDSDKAADMSGIFPITGQGYSRRSDNGIPWYRVDQAMKALFSYDTELPAEYNDAGFGGVIDFRGYNYVVDWGGIPTEEIPNTYYLDFDQISMMDLAQELCDVLSRDLFVSLLPVIDHPSCAYLYKKNQELISKAAGLPSGEKTLVLGSGLVTGIIRIDTIDKKKPPKVGAIKKYLDELESKNIFVENRDIGFEVSNVTTDRFIVGAQEVDMYYFNGLRDRDNYAARRNESGSSEGKSQQEAMQEAKWKLKTCCNQQILPYYGLLGNNAVSIPRGFGSYQQILLDATNLDAHGVGAYYVATEMELRAAAVSYEQWKKFLILYNELYIQELSENQAFYAELSKNLAVEIPGINDQIDSDGELSKQLDALTKGGRNFGVAVPRSVWNSDKSPQSQPQSEDDETPPEEPAEEGAAAAEAGPEENAEVEGSQWKGQMGSDGYPASPCSPPFGYPLYYKRAEKLGIPEAGIVKVGSAIIAVQTNIGRLQNMETSDKQRFSYSASIASASIRRLRSLIDEKAARASRMSADANPDAKAALSTDIQILQDRITEIQENVKKEAEELGRKAQENADQVAHLKSVVKANKGFIRNKSKYERESIANSKKVHAFLKKIADECLGKKFLVKIPRACNVNYSKELKIQGDKAWDVIKGPFGFPPNPISTTPDYKGGKEWKDQLKAMKGYAKKAERESVTDDSTGHSWHYIDVETMGQAVEDDKYLIPGGSGYTYGALKCNWNPMSEKWEYNYRPEPQGGFFNFALYHKNLKGKEAEASGISEKELPAATRALLAPKLLDKLLNSNKRLECYVRYDHSQHLDFSSVNAQDVAQQSIGKDGTIIPDVMETLPNLNPDRRGALDEIQQRTEDDKLLERQAESVAFVKCSLDERFYMPPKIVYGDPTIWAEEYGLAFAPVPYEVVYVDAAFAEANAPEEYEKLGEGPWDGCQVPISVKKRPVPIFTVPSGGGSKGATSPWDDFDREWSDTYKGWIVKTEDEDLESQHVYAVITVPGRITPTVSKRYVDGPQKALNGPSIANTLTEDVVKIKAFENPKGEDQEDPVVDCSNFPSGVDISFEDISRALRAHKDAAKGIALSQNGDNSNLAFTSPSPIYPDLVAIPLMSMERCYGPWVSSALNGASIGGSGATYSDIGGKIEFIKDESLNPWSYAGYQLMDQAAKLKTKFSNSLLLFSERGSFSYPEGPIDVSLAKALQDQGPLVTSISVDVGNNSIKTSVKLDLYTAQFGKLHKQKELAIAQISRERQKIIDQNNSNIRRGLGKGAASMSLFGDFMKKGGQALLDAAKGSDQYFTDLQKGKNASPNNITVSAMNSSDDFDAGSFATNIKSEDAAGLMQSDSELNEKQSLFDTQADFDSAMEKTAGGNIADLFKGVSDAADNAFFASRRPDMRNQIDRRILR